GAALLQESKTLTAADVLIWTERPFSENALYIIDEKLEGHGATATTQSIETTTMARPDDDESQVATMIELRAVEEAFPFYGTMELRGGRPYEHSLLRNRGAVVRPELLTRLGVDVGDTIRIGDASFTIRDVIVREAGRSVSMFTMGPRVFIDYADVGSTGLFDFGSRLRRQILVRADGDEVQELVWDLEGALANEFVRVRSFREAGDRLARRLNRGESYLSLAGFVILILGGVGVWSVIRVFIAQKLKSIAVLKCLGATTRQVLLIYVCQVFFLSVVGSAMGLLIAQFAVSLIPSGLGVDLKDVEYGLTSSAVVQGVGVGLLVSALFSLIPLLHVRLVRPLWLLRPEGNLGPSTKRRRLDRVQIVAGAVLVVALVGLAVWQAGSIRIGWYVCATFVAVAVALHLAGVGLVKAVSPLARKAYFPLRHAVLNVSRPGNQTRVVLLAVGLGCCFVLTVRNIQSNLLEQFAIELRDDAPDMFFIDIQPDQTGTLEARARRFGADTVKLVPVLRARVVGVAGAAVQLDDYGAVREQGSLGREYTITYRDHLEDNERILDGAFWDGAHSTDPEVSIESSLRDRYQIDVGDRMTFDIMGRRIVAKVTSIRDVEWSDARNGGFMFVFRPGGLEDVPNTYAGFIKGPRDPMERARFQRDLVADYYNISIVDLRDVLDALAQVVDKVSLAISVVGSVALLSGAMILLGSVAMTKYQRRYETAIFRTLGASRRRVATMMLLEYGTLGAIAGIIGAVGGGVLAFLLSNRILEVPFRPELVSNLAAVLIAALAVSLVGVAVTLDVVRQKPLAILRVG
ncbi:MAG TPA: FtsX-like permease family protein, partial [Vicinamibacteria bacterium]|nr:FtsX-like permease family protein [Vicinamibacteria bacterium]